MRAIIVGGTSGLGETLAGVFLSAGWDVAVTGVRDEALRAFGAKHPTAAARKLDLLDLDTSRRAFDELLRDAGDVEAVVVNAGRFERDPDAAWEIERRTIQLNALGCTAVLNAAFHYLLSRGGGRLAGVSSIGAVRGNGACPAYNASKAFLSNYLEGLRQNARLRGARISITDVTPGYVATSDEAAARRIFSAIVSGKRRVYEPPRWRPLAALYRNLPDLAHEKMAGWHDQLLKPFLKAPH